MIKFSIKSKKNKKDLPVFLITEGIEGCWNYHISRSDNENRSLCGRRVMNTSMTMDQWGIKADHIPESFCQECKDLYNKEMGR